MTVDGVPGGERTPFTGGGRLVVDAANVIGSVPDGWWRDRHGATERLRDRLAAAVAAVPPREATPVTLVVEGRASGVGGVPGVEVVAAPGSGDDAIVDLVARHGGGCVVVTADRGLRERVAALGASVVGPGTLRSWLERLPGP